MGSALVSDVLFFHGFLGLPSDFDSCISHLESENIKSVVYTKITGLTPEVYISDWGQSFLRSQIGSDPLTAVGYSQGGRLLLGAFAQDPQRFKKLILVSSHCGLKSFTEKEARLNSDRQWARQFRNLSWDQLMKDWNSQAVFQKGAGVHRSEKDFNREDLALCFENWSLAHQSNYMELIQRNKNIHVVVGEHDQKYRDLYSELGSRLLITKGAAHRVPSDQPIHLAEILNSIL